MLRISCLFLFVGLSHFTVHCQSSTANSSSFQQEERANTEAYSEQLKNADLLEDQFEIFEEMLDDTIIHYHDEVMSYVEQSSAVGSEEEKALANYILLRLLTSEGKYVQAIEIAPSTIQMAKSLLKNIDIKYKSQYYYSLALDSNGDLEEANKITYSLINEIENDHLLSWQEKSQLHYQNYILLANHYLFRIDSLANLYIGKALDNARKIGDSTAISHSINLSYYANYYGNDGYLLNEIADSCIHYYLILKDDEGLGQAYMHKCNALVVLDRADEAEKFCEKAIQVFKKTRDPIYLSSVYNNIGNVFEKTDDPDRSFYYYEKAHEIAVSVEDGVEYLKSLNNLARKHLDAGNYQKSAELYKQFADSQFVFQNELLNSQFAEFESKYQNEEKEKELVLERLNVANQKAIRNRVILGGSILFLVGLALFQWYRNRQRRIAREAEFLLEQKRRETEQLRSVDKMKTQFFTNVSHELRTPLTLITGPLETVLEKNTNPQIDKDLRLAHSNSKRLNGLVSEILDLAKIESGKMKIKPIEVNIHSLLNRIYFAFESYAESKKVQLEIQNRLKEDIHVMMDVDKVETIVNNLMSNAVKFTEGGGKVVMDAAESNGMLLLSVRDEGPGIPDGDEDRIFERFYQSEQKRLSFSGGTGVGLALTKEIVELMNGQISASNNQEDGATFTVMLPIEKVTPSFVEPSEKLETEESKTYTPILLNGERPKVLIVEDNQEMGEYIASILEEHYECSFAADGYECLQRIQKEHYDLISSDVMMPRMDGFTLKKKINELERFRNTPFIFLTARVLEEDKLEGLQLGVDDYITKPFNKREYLTRVDNLLKNLNERKEVGDHEIQDSADRKLIKQAESWILERLSDSEIKVSDLAEVLNYSQRQLGRIIKKLTGLTPVGLILEIRLQKAYQWILEKKYQTLSEVRFEVGIESASYFSTKFKERFGVSPSELG